MADLADIRADIYEDDRFATAADAWIAYIGQSVRERSLIRYETLLRRYVYPVYGDVSVGDIPDDELGRFAVRLADGEFSDTPLSARTVSFIVTTVRRVREYWLGGATGLKFSVSWGYDLSIPDIYILTASEKKRLTDAPLNGATTAETAVLLCMECGIKVGELCAMAVKDALYPAKNAVHIHGSMQRVQNRRASSEESRTRIEISEYPKGSPLNRILPVPEWLCESIAEKKDASLGDFLLSDGTERVLEPRTMQNRLKKTGDACGIPNLTFNVLRDTYALSRIRDGADIRSLSMELGHSCIAVTERRYGRYYEKLDADLKSKIPSDKDSKAVSGADK